MSPREYLAGLEFHGIKLGLDNIRRLVELAGRPETACPVIHVAGTNGKGSVVAFLDAIFRAGGYRTGRFTSPHLIDVNERLLLDGAPISDADLDAHIQFFQDAVRDWDHPPTYFEMVTAVAFRAFAERGVDAALIEVGMGGRFDATNVVNPAVAVITNIALEHTRYLGDTLEKIAFEKAGVLKPGAALICGETQPGPLAVILARAAEESCPTRLLGRDFSCRIEGEGLRPTFRYADAALRIGPLFLGLPGRYQAPNAALAIAAAQALQEKFPGLTPLAIEAGLRKAKWPCRLEQVLDDPPVIIDVAHNAAGAAQLAAEFERAAVVLAVASDKAAGEMVQALAPIADPLILTQFDGARALALDALAAAAGPAPYERAETLETALERGLRYAGPGHPLLIAGSFHTAGQARAWLIQHRNARPLEF